MKTYIVRDKRTNTRYELDIADIKKTKEDNKEFLITTNNKEHIVCDYIMCFMN